MKNRLYTNYTPGTYAYDLYKYVSELGLKEVVEIKKAKRNTLITLNYHSIHIKNFREVNESGFRIIYKVINKKLYLLDCLIPPPEHFNCKCQLILKPEAEE